jgi:hypothetical protein
MSLAVYNEGAPLMGEVVAYMFRAGFEVLGVVESHYLNDIIFQVDFAFARRKSAIFQAMNRHIGIKGDIRRR